MALLRQLPNAITLTRLIGGPALAYVFANGSERPTAFFTVIFVWFFCLVATDWLDGFLAHLLGAQSRFGAILDPLADKALAWSFLGFFFFGTRVFNAWMFVPLGILAIFDLYSTIRRFIQRKAPETHLRANWFGKWKAVMSYLSIACLLSATIAVSFLYEFWDSASDEMLMGAVFVSKFSMMMAQISIAAAALFAFFSTLLEGLRRVPAQH
ncbi:MAG: CDP-alcohol phosphatidyltransferase family protein [Candidatus Niyogibacteria bacterium]|nr:CDP-alcohol phosphatidyltransferase family protein [Candidatus Niyogibacteria bacterium]